MQNIEIPENIRENIENFYFVWISTWLGSETLNIVSETLNLVIDAEWTLKFVEP